MKHHITTYIAAALILAACSGSPKETVSVYVWQRVTAQTDMDSLQMDFHNWKSKGITGVCVDVRGDNDRIEDAARRAHAEGLEYHAWVPSMLRSNLPHEWYAVNRLGQSADENPNYMNNYRFLDPANPQVQEFLIEQYTQVAQIPDVDYVRLDFIRYPDVILASALGELYGITNEGGEYAPADYCYCDYCTKTFFEQTSIDIKSVEDPAKVPQWAQFRCDQLTLFVDRVTRAIHEVGKKVSVDVFPGPGSYAERMVRQQWNQWMVDMFFPMNYNDLYEEGPEWLGPVVEEEVQSAGGVPVISSLRICRDWKNPASKENAASTGLLPSELPVAIHNSLTSGASGICLFNPSRMSPEHWDALEEALKAEVK
jgi:uncharacterized lipoprotein YddW (UPF0748 family)